MNAHVIQFAERRMMQRASLIELRDARRIAKRTGNHQVAAHIAREIMRRLCDETDSA